MSIDFSDITEGTVEGNGTFDVLMRSIKAHVAQEFDANRIKGSDYATVYLGAIQTAISQALQYSLQAPLTDAQVNNLALEAINIPKQGDVLDAQERKTIAEKELLEQKLKTEQAQITDLVDGASVGGLVGKQQALYAAQTDGFTRDAEQKAAQIYGNLASVIYSTDPDAISPLNAGFGETNIKSVLSRLAAGVSVTI